MEGFQEFPKWKYHAEKEARIVHSAEAEAALGDEWGDSPAEFEGSSEQSLVQQIEEFVHERASGSKKLPRKGRA